MSIDNSDIAFISTFSGVTFDLVLVDNDFNGVNEDSLTIRILIYYLLFMDNSNRFLNVFILHMFNISDLLVIVFV